MKRFMLWIFLSSPALAQTQSIYTPQGLDKKEAHLNQQWKRAEAIATAYASFKKIRLEQIDHGFQKAVFDWHNEMGVWFDNWKTPLEILSSNGLASPEKQQQLSDGLKKQATHLDKLTLRITEIKAIGTKASADLQSLPRFPGNYVDILETSNRDNYANQLAAYVAIVDQANAKLDAAQKQFTAALVGNLGTMTERVGSAAVSRMRALSLQFPDLRAAVARYEAQLLQVRLVDSVIDRLKDESSAISMTLLQDKYFTAKTQLEAWKVRVTAAKASMATNARLTSQVRSYGRESLDGLIRVREAQFADRLRVESTLEIFSGFYNKELYGTLGMVKRCTEVQPPQDVDCNRLRLIQGFKNSQLLELPENAAAFIEREIVKARRPKIQGDKI